MKPADNGKRKYDCPFLYTDKINYPACKTKFKFHELFWHLREMHSEHSLLAWMVAATWEDVCSGHEADCA